jgi:predicted NAD/FAD-binding protein
MDPKLKASVDDFMSAGGMDGDNPKYHEYTLERYIDEKSQERGWDPRLGPWVIYPRVNGMYFTSSELGPRRMPFYSVMHYYKIQEGAGGKPANRMYFVGGTSHWIDRLTDYMARTLDVKLVADFPAVVSRDSTGWKVTNSISPKEQYQPDLVVIASHANDALKLLKTISPQVSNIMSQITYETAISVAHVDARLLPVDQNAWCTYNIVIHQPGSVAMKPYVINYVANRHQNDAANPEYDKFGLPQFFVSVNPHLPIREEMVLKDEYQREAVTYLHHNVFDFACIQAQADIKLQQGKSGLYYAGGWTYGSGLHEECWQQGIEIAGLILGQLSTGKEPEHAPVKAFELMHERLRKTASAT